MKVQLEQFYKDVYTVAELEQAKAVIKSAKEDTASAKDYAAVAVREVFRANRMFDGFELLKVEAHTEKNITMAYDGYCEGSGFMDVCLEIIAKVDGVFGDFLEVSARVSDIWNIDGENNIAALFYVKWYKLKRD